MTIYRSALISRRPDLTEQEFRDHWIRVHGFLSSKMPGVGSYRQNHILERFHEDLHPSVQAIDGISQLSFESIGAMEVSDVSPEYAAVKADIRKFQGGITILVLRSTNIMGPQQPTRYPAKLMWISTQRSEDAQGSVEERWLRRDHDAGAIAGARRFVQNFVVDRGHPVSAGVPAGDARKVEAVSELWFDDVDALRAAVTSKEGRRLIFDDELLKPMAVYGIDEIHIL